MTEHGGFVFVFYFLAEYSNIALISAISATLWLGGYTLPIIDEPIYLSGIVLGVKALLLVLTVIWVRGTLPRLRFDQLMYACWSIFLPLVFALVTLIFSLYVLTN
jgi:NADH-ubiquinone oxidoreductase chain 1